LKPEKIILPINSLHFQLSKGGAFLTTKKKKNKPNPKKKPNLLLFQGSRRPPCFFVGFSVLFSLQPATADFPSPRRFTISFPSPQLPNITSSLSATTDFPSPIARSSPLNGAIIVPFSSR
jgi:hypothetical protein